MKRKILITDDVVLNRLMLSRALQDEYDIVEAENGEEAVAVIQEQHDELAAVLLDIDMPKMDGYEALQWVRDHVEYADLPILMVTGSEDEDSRIKALALGANDFILKPYNMEIIRHCLNNNIAMYDTAAKLNALQRDKLTGLLNREAFFEKAEELIATHEPGYYLLSSFDVDNFKLINTQFGTVEGDKLLRQIGIIVREQMRAAGGISARFANDNFAALLPATYQNSNVESTLQQKQREATEKHLLTISTGRYLITDTTLPVSAIYERAYIAKQSIKGKYGERMAYFNEAMLENLLRNQQLGAEAEAAIAARQFELWYQPQHNHNTGALVGAEALVRWRHPEKGLIFPGEFIPLFENNGFIYELDKYVWEEACARLRRWIDAGIEIVPVSVNVSRQDVYRPDFVETIIGLVEKYCLPVELLRLEITESAFAQSTDMMVAVIRQLIEAGFVIEIDDFGSGYSSLNTLKSVPAQVVKLDMRFLHDNNDAERGGNILSSVVRMTKWLGMSVIAEGVEEKAQADYLASIGCSYMQGYLYAKPMPAAEYESYCSNLAKEHRLRIMNAVENLDNNAFWNPKSMDTLIFSSYVGGACIFEYAGHTVELLRANRKFASILGDGTMSIADTLKLDWLSCLEPESRKAVREVLYRSCETKEEYTNEYVFLNIPGAPEKTYLRATMRVIATSGERWLVYCTCENITAQREAEARAQKAILNRELAAGQMQAILDNVDVGVVASIRGKKVTEFLFANGKFFEMLGYTREQFAAEISDPYLTFAPEERAWVKELFDSHIEREESGAVEAYMLRRDGSRRLVRDNFSTCHFVGIDEAVQLSIFRDITEEHEAQQREQLAAEQVKNMMGDMPGGLMRLAVSSDGTITPAYFNDGFLKLLGLSEEGLRSLYGANILESIHPDDVATVKETIQNLLENGETHTSRYRLRHGHGRYIWVSTVERSSKDAEGNHFINVYFTDVTAQTKQEELEKSLMDNLPCGAGIYEYKDGQMRLIYQNKIYWELVGLHEEAYPDPSSMSAIHPDDLPVIMQELTAAIAQQRDVDCDVRLRHLTLGYRPARIVGRIVKTEGGFLIYAAFTPNDQKDNSFQQLLPRFLAAMLESSTDIVFAKDKNLRYICGSKAFVELSGRKNVAELIGKTDAELFEKELADRRRREDEALLAGGESFVDIAEVISTGDGATRHVNISKFVLLDGEGKQIGIVGTGRDITESRKTASHLELLTNNIPGGIAVFEGTAEAVKVTYFSDGLCRIFGYTREVCARLLEQDQYCFVSAEDKPELMRQVSALLSDGRPLDYIYRACCSDGSHKWVTIKAVMGEPDGDSLTVNAVFFDVTQRREAVERLRVSEEINRIAIEQSAGMVCRFDIATRQLTLPMIENSIFEVDCIKKDVPHKPVRDGKVSADTADTYIAFYESILRGEKKGTARFRYTSKQGWRWMEAHFTTIFADNGEPDTAVVSVYDITETVEKEAVYRRWKQSLHGKRPESYSYFRCSITKARVLEATEGLLLPQTQLIQTDSLERRTASYADNCVAKQDRQRYLSFLNRETMLLRYSQGRRSETLEYRENLPDGGYRWLRLSVEFLDTPGTTEVEAFFLFEDIDKEKRAELEILDRAEKDQLTGVYNRNHFIGLVEQRLAEQRKGRSSALFLIDLDGFKRVNNAFGHAAGDETLIEIGQKLRDTFQEDDLLCRLGGDEFMVFMQNVTYLGAVKERAALLCALLHKSFSLEIQLSASIGIAISPKNGTDFETLYRRADAALFHVKSSGKDSYALYSQEMTERELPTEAESEEEAISAAAPYAKPKPRMLIVEDNTPSLKYLTSLFRKEYLIETAAEGTAALVRLNRYGAGVSVVLLDLMITGLDAFAVLKKMRESVTMQHIPVVVICDVDDRESILAAVREGASDYIARPIDFDLLKLRVASAISKAENARLRAQNQYLAMQNEETKRLTEARAHSEELSVALHAAEKADLAKSQFLSSMSHEIRTPLNAVIGYNAIAIGEMSAVNTAEERRQASMKVLDCLTKSEIASRHLLTIINDVLDMSAIESGKLKVSASPFDFRSLLTALTVMFYAQAKAKGVRFEVHFEKPTEEWFVGDQLRINQVLTNLLSNAVKFTPEGGSVALKITAAVIDDEATDFCFVVEDTGIGMTQEYLEHIWTPFEQGEATISRRFGGSGLGLSITKNLLELMNGSIAVESKSGVGSTFTVKLRLQRTVQPQRQVNVDFSQINALVVDDDMQTCDYIKRLFDRCGAQCMTFTSGREAVAAFAAAKQQGKPFSICLIDWRMPQMDGFTTISEIRHIAANDLPIVVVTAYDFTEIENHAASLEINRFISKPLFQSSLYDLLISVCGNQVNQAVGSIEKTDDYGGARVLLVEDNNMNMEIAKHLLYSANLCVDCAWNGQQAVDIFAASKPDTYKAVLMDIHMPVLDGYQATKLIRAADRPDAKTIPIIAMTADAFAEDVAQAHTVGMNAHVAKPIDIATFFRVLDTYIK